MIQWFFFEQKFPTYTNRNGNLISQGKIHWILLVSSRPSLQLFFPSLFNARINTQRLLLSWTLLFLSPSFCDSFTYPHFPTDVEIYAFSEPANAPLLINTATTLTFSLSLRNKILVRNIAAVTGNQWNASNKIKQQNVVLWELISAQTKLCN